jgi:hypothetical protein
MSKLVTPALAGVQAWRLLLLVVLAGSRPAWAQVDEDALFGGGGEPGQAAAEQAQPTLQAGEGMPAPLAEGHVGASLREAESTLAVGGQAYFRLNGVFLEHTSPAHGALSSPNLLDVYLDARPNDRVRAFAKGRVKYDATVRDGSTDDFGNVRRATTALLPELWLKFDLARTLYVTLGRQPLRWGSGYFWNPTDFVNRTRKDPLAVFDERPGVDALKLHLPVESLGWNFYALALTGAADRAERVGVAGRAEFAVWQMELATSASWRQGDALRLGADLTMGLWDLDLRLEAAVTHGDRTTYFKGPADFTVMPPVFPASYSRRDEWLPHLMGGLEWTIPYGDDDSLVMGAEYSWQQAGYTDPDLYPALFAQGTYNPLYTGRHYAGVYALAMGPGRWDDGTLLLAGLGNLSDRSFMARAEVRVLVLTYLSLNAFAGYHFGANGELHYSLRVPPAPQAVVDALPAEWQGLAASGMDLNAPAVEVGLGLLLKL